MAAIDKIQINAADRMNPLWPKVMDLLTQRLGELRVQNDRDMTEAQTANLRGRIAEIKALMAQNNDTPIID